MLVILTFQQSFIFPPLYIMRKFLTAEWRKLAIANYVVDKELLRPFVPYKTEIDVWNNNCYISLVGFRFINTKLLGLPIPFHRQFEEINLRFYVRYKESGTWKRGVTFIREIVPKPALTIVANMLYGEKYVTLPTRHTWKSQAGKLEVCYSWKSAKKWNRFSVIAQSAAHQIDEGSEEEFITEHYWGYTPVNRHCCSEYQVEHPRWQVYPVQESRIDVNFRNVYGQQFSLLDTMKPASVMLAEGSEIAVYAGKKIR
jgi:uncharacterized protein